MGLEIQSIWKYLIVLFKASDKKNYAIESLSLLAQYNILLPPSMGVQLKWSSLSTYMVYRDRM